MRERALIYLVVVLVVINVAALGTIIYQRVAGPFWKPDRAGDMVNPPDVPRELRLTVEQRKALRESRRCLDSLLAPVHAQINERRQQLMNEMESTTPDTGRIDQLLGEIGTLQIQIEKTMVHNLLADSKTFTPEQREWFLKKIKQHAKWQDGPMMGPGQGFGRGAGAERGGDSEHGGEPERGGMRGGE
jgi:Spy/CpxP family protein refolding chaperone